MEKKENNELLSLENILKSFHKKEVFREVNLTLKANECIALIGKNGCGKTTLLQIISRLIKPTKGKVKININPKKLSYAAEEIWLYPDLTTKENITYFGKLHNIKNPILDKKAENLIELANLNFVKNKYVKKLSHGMKRRLNIITALINDPTIILLDEPYLGLDKDSLDIVKKMILELKNMGKSLIISTHNFSDVEKIATKLAILHDNKLILDDTLNSISKGREILQIQTTKKYDFSKYKPIEKENEYLFLTDDGYKILKEIISKCDSDLIDKIKFQKASIDFLYYFHTGEKIANSY